MTAWGLLAACALFGCRSAGQLTIDGSGRKGTENSAAFLDRVSDLQQVSIDDATRGIMMLSLPEKANLGFAERVEILADRGIVDPSWTFAADAPVTRGQLAYMVYQATGIDGGLMLALTGPSRRYCYRELQYRNVMASAFQRGSVGGMEFVGVLSRADTYNRTGKVPDRSGSIEN